MGNIIYTIENCGVCGASDIKQPQEPSLKYIVDKPSGRGASVQCCNACAKKIVENQRAEAALKKHEQQEAAKQIAVVPDPVFVAQADADEGTQNIQPLRGSDGRTDKRSPVSRIRSKGRKHSGRSGKLRTKRA